MTDRNPEPGWQADPSGRHELRYWDGQSWTEHVGNAGVVAADPWPREAAVVPTPPTRPSSNRGVLVAAITAGLAVAAVLVWAFLLRGDDERDLVADQARIDAAILIRADLPSGFSTTPVTAAEEYTFLFSEPGCTRLSEIQNLTATEPERRSDRFARPGEAVGDELEIENRLLATSSSNAAEYVAAMQATDAVECLQGEIAAIEDTVPEGVTVGGTSARQGEPLDLGDESARIVTTTDLIIEGLNAPFPSRWRST